MIQQRTVLIVDDSDSWSATLELALLALPRIGVHRASSGQEALDVLNRANSEPVCAVITDLRMPRMDGFELLEKIRSDPRHAALPVIVLSGDADPHNPERVLKLGASAYFSKPFSPALVRKKVEELLDGPAP